MNTFLINNLNSPRKRLRLDANKYYKKGYYFLTICTQNRRHLFGNISNGIMRLNNAGKMLDEIWNILICNYKNIDIDCKVTMPDHIHVITEIKNSSQLISIPDIVRDFKAYSTKRYINGVQHEGWPEFDKKLWQRSYHEHIIRTHQDLDKIKKYINDNPKNWKL